MSSYRLLLGQVRGEVFRNAVLTVRKAGEASFEPLVITLRNVVVRSVSTGGNAGDDLITEHVALLFDSIEYEYTTQNPDGSVGDKVRAGVNQSARCN